MTDFFTYFIQGLARGSVYALVGLGLVIIFKATHVLNFGHGALMSIGAYLCYTFNGGVAGQFTTLKPWTVAHLPFVVSLVLAMVTTGLIGLAIEALVLRRFRGRPVFTIIMATFGIAIIVQYLTGAIWGDDAMSYDEPIGLKSTKVFGVPVTLADVVTFLVAIGVTVAFLVFFNKSRMGTAMRATAYDQEAAIAQGISAKRIFGLSWAIAAALATLAAVLLSTGNGRTVSEPQLQLVAFAAFPAIILGGVDSTTGAIVGGMVIGMAEQLMFGYENSLQRWMLDNLHIQLGGNFHIVFPYLLMLVILLFRPYGFFGTREVRRV